MFKKTLIAVAILLSVAVLLPQPTVAAIEIGLRGSVGFLIQKADINKIGYSVGEYIPILTDTSKNFVIGNETDIVYLQRKFKDVNEMFIIRTFFIGTKYMPNHFYTQLGIGGWKIVNTLGADSDNLAFKFGFGWEPPKLGIDVNASFDVVRAPDEDIYYIGLNILLFNPDK